MSEKGSRKDGSTSPAAKADYDVPRSNPYLTLSLCTVTPPLRQGLHTVNAMRASEERDTPLEPQYASPDEMKVVANRAYALNNGTPTPPSHETHFYALPDEISLKTPTLPTAKHPGDGNEDRSLRCRMALCFAACTVAFLLAVGLAGSSLVLVLISQQTSPPPPQVAAPLPQEPCSCDTSQLSSAISGIEERLERTNLEAEQERDRVQILAELVENATSLLAVEPPTREVIAPRQNVSGILHDCKSSIEANCTVPLDLGVCTTPCINEIVNDTLAVNFQCIRLESFEQNPMIGVLDITGGQAFCFCYVVEAHGRRRTHLVDCALRVTRCSLAHVQV